MDNQDSEWARRGATLSDTTAAREFGLTRDEIYQSLSAGALSYRQGSMHGNPWFRLLRREVEELVLAKHGAGYLKDRQMKTELAGINRDLKRLKAVIAQLEARKATLTVELAAK